MVSSSYFSSKCITTGVSQGSGLWGPFLFQIYVNDIAEALDSSSRLFADDWTLAVFPADR